MIINLTREFPDLTSIVVHVASLINILNHNSWETTRPFFHLSHNSKKFVSGKIDFAQFHHLPVTILKKNNDRSWLYWNRMTFELYLRFTQTTSWPDVVTNVGLLGDHQRYVVTHGARNELTGARTKPRKRSQIFLSLLFLLQKGNWPDS